MNPLHTFTSYFDKSRSILPAFSPDIITVIMTRRMKWAGMQIKFSSHNLKERNHSEDEGVDAPLLDPSILNTCGFFSITFPSPDDTESFITDFQLFFELHVV